MQQFPLPKSEVIPAASVGFHPIEQLLDIATVMAITSLSETMVQRLVRKHEFPTPMVLSRDRLGLPSRVAWKAGEIRRWIAERSRAA